MTKTPAHEGLQTLALADIPPSDALKMVREKLSAPTPDDAQAIHDALRSALWKLLTGRIYDESMRDWHRVFRRAHVSMISQGYSALAERCRLMSELAVESARYGKAHATDSVISRSYVREILNLILSRGGTIERSEIIRQTGVKQANLSRILSTVLLPCGLVERENVGGSAVSLTLTPLGRSLISRQPNRPAGAGTLSIDPPLEETRLRASADPR